MRSFVSNSLVQIHAVAMAGLGRAVRGGAIGAAAMLWLARRLSQRAAMLSCREVADLIRAADRHGRKTLRAWWSAVRQFGAEAGLQAMAAVGEANGHLATARREAAELARPPHAPKHAKPGRGWTVVTGALTALCGSAGAGLLLAAVTMESPRPPQPVAQAETTSSVQQQPEPAQNQPNQLSRSEPIRLEIPAINVKADLLSLGVDAKDEVGVPPLDRAELASWYNLGPSPGEPGSAVIVGHVDSEKTGPAAFFNLGRLTSGDLVKVLRKDGSVAQFKVDSVKSFPKADFPAQLVYGGEERATLKLVTCGGDYDKKQKNYLSNVVVFASYSP